MHNNIRSERVRIGLTTNEVAEHVGVSNSAVFKWESQEIEPSGRNIVKLARLFGCSPDYLLDMTEERLPKKVKQSKQAESHETYGIG